MKRAKVTINRLGFYPDQSMSLSITTTTALTPNVNVLGAVEFWQASRLRPVVDVRSPAEYAQGHLPNAVNLPLFDDQERAQVGTIFKHSGRDDAILRGLSLVGPKMSDFAKQARQLAKDKQILVHCWRGGMRSQSMAWLFGTIGLQVSLLDGGYKAFRHLARSYFSHPWNLRVVSGLTGAGKSDVLACLKPLGQQVVDLETLACHRGSAFGSIGQPDQPTTEQVENNLFADLFECDPDQVIWVEDEGNRLGTVVVPPEFVTQIRHAPADFLELSAANRVERLLLEYGQFSGERLIESVAAIRKRLGPQHADEAESAIAAGDIRRAIEIVLDYYDRTYSHAAAKMPRREMQPLNIDGLAPEQVAQTLVRGSS